MSFKNFIRQIARKHLGTSHEVIDLQVLFHKDANYFGAHGYLEASSVEHGVMNSHVRFVFPGLSTPPAMTPRIMEYIWEEAKAAGFLPQALVSYGLVLATDKSVNSGSLVSARQRRAEVSALAGIPEKCS